MFTFLVTAADNSSKIMSSQRPKKVWKSESACRAKFARWENSGGNDAEDQENISNWELSVLKEELSNENDTENAPDLSATSHATILSVTSNSD